MAHSFCAPARSDSSLFAVYLIQLLLPLSTNDGHPQPHERFSEVRRVLTERFGGVTAYTHAPAEGIWKDDRGCDVYDAMVIVEVMAGDLDLAWWRAFRKELERDFEQEEILVRATSITQL